MKIAFGNSGQRASARPPRWLGLVFVLVGLGLLAGAGVAAWLEVEFRRQAVETDGRVVAMLSRTGSSSGSGGQSTTYTPVFAFRLPDGKEIRVEAGFSSSPPCCRVGEAIRVRYDPARPDRAQMVSFMSSWFVAALLGGMGAVFTLVGGLAVAFLRSPASPPLAQGAERAMVLAVPLVGMRRDAAADGPRWVLQARWADPRSGLQRMFESEPLPFDPVPQMREMTHVQVAFDPSLANGPYRMDLSFLQPPAPQGPIRRG